MRKLSISLLMLSAALAACSDDEDTEADGGTFVTDTGGIIDLGVTDSGTDVGVADLGTDAGSDAGADLGATDTGAVDMGASDMGAAVDTGVDGGVVMMDTGVTDIGTPDTGVDAGPADMGMDAGTGDMGTPGTAGTDIAAVRAVASGASSLTVSPSLPIRGATVTYVTPSTAGDVGFFVQAGMTGPAIFVRSTSTVMVGDVVTFDVTQVNDLTGLLEVTGIANLSTLSSGGSVTGLIQDVSTATDTVSALDGYESELIRVSATTTGAPGGAGTGYVASTITTAGVTSGTSLRLRTPTDVDTTLGLGAGCSITFTGVMWRYYTTAQPQIFTTSDISALSCTPSAAASTATTLVVDLGRNVDATTVAASDFSVTGLTLSNPVVSGSQVTLTTSMQTSGTTYTVTISGITDALGYAVSGSATFNGYTAPASIVINEVMYDEPGGDTGADIFTELYGPAGTSLTGYTLVGVNGSNNSDYLTVNLTGTIPSDGFVVIAGSAAAGSVLASRDITESVDWQNGPDAIQLRDAAGAVVDALQYGTTSGFAAGEGTPATDVSNGTSLTRDAAHSDTGDNATDFTASATPTPGS